MLSTNISLHLLSLLTSTPPQLGSTHVLFHRRLRLGALLVPLVHHRTQLLGRVAFEVLRRCHAQVVPQDRRQPRLGIQCADVIASCLSRLSTTEACHTVRPCDRHLLLRLSTMAAGHAGPRLTDMPSPYRRRRSSSPCVRPRVVSDRPLRNSM